MSTATPTPTAPAAAVAAAGLRPPSLARLTLVELRKAVDTRPGMWLLASVVLVAAGAVAVALMTGDEPRTYAQLVWLTAVPTTFLLPVLGVLAMTSEWSQRTILITITLVPRRERLIAAKAIAGAIAAVGATTACLVAAAVGGLIGDAAGADEVTWSLPGHLVGNLVLIHLVNILLGMGFGALLLNSPLAILLYFALPFAWSVTGQIVGWLQKPALWLDLELTTRPLTEGALAGGQWARLAVSVVVWVGIPLALGSMRIARREAS